MNKILVISVLNGSDDVLPFDGVMKKISNEINAFQSFGYEVDFTENIDGVQYFVCKDGKIPLFNIEGSHIQYYNKLLRKTARFIQSKRLKYGFIYIRYDSLLPKGIFALNVLKKSCKKLYVEIPTFYVKEHYSFKEKIKILFNKRMKNSVDKIVTYSLDDTIYGINTIKINNGINVSKIKERINFEQNDKINVLMVAMISGSHGIDKIIKAVETAEKEELESIIFHIVGDGPLLKSYIEEVKEKSLEKYIIFYGKQGGDELDHIYEKADIGISTLSAKENGLAYCSSLKSKEYLCKGLPIISDVDMDLFLNNPKYYFYKFEEPFTLRDVKHYYDEIYHTRTKEMVYKDLRKFAEETCDMKITMLPIDKDFKEEN